MCSEKYLLSKVVCGTQMLVEQCVKVALTHQNKTFNLSSFQAKIPCLGFEIWTLKLIKHKVEKKRKK